MKPYKEKPKVKVVLCFFILVVSFNLFFNCLCNKSNNGKELKSQYSDNTKLIFNKSKDSICNNWKEPNDSLVKPILEMMREINSYEWNQFFGTYDCNKIGVITLENKTYKYKLNAGGWVILYDSINDKNIYFGMKNKKGKKYFLSIMFNENDENWE